MDSIPISWIICQRVCGMNDAATGKHYVIYITLSHEMFLSPIFGTALMYEARE